MDVAY